MTPMTQELEKLALCLGYVGAMRPELAVWLDAYLKQQSTELDRLHAELEELKRQQVLLQALLDGAYV